MDRNLKVAIIGIFIGIVGTAGTYYQMYGEKLIWIALIGVGISLFSYFVWSLLKEVRTVVATFGSRWKIIDGRLRIGNTINVALRVDTVLTIIESSRDLYSNNDEFNQSVKKTGRKIGEEFASELRAELIQAGKETIIKAGKTEPLIREKLALWSKYDSSTGIGIFDTESVILENNLLKGHIIVKNTFLTFDRHSSTPTCWFLSGYIEGIILHLLDIAIIIKETSCSSINGKGECIFELETPQNDKT